MYYLEHNMKFEILYSSVDGIVVTYVLNSKSVIATEQHKWLRWLMSWVVNYNDKL